MLRPSWTVACLVIVQPTDKETSGPPLVGPWRIEDGLQRAYLQASGGLHAGVSWEVH